MRIYDNSMAAGLRTAFLNQLDNVRRGAYWPEVQEFASSAVKLVAYTQLDLWEDDKVDVTVFNAKGCPECEECDEFSVETPVLVDINYDASAKLNMFAKISEIDPEATVRCSNCMYEGPWWTYTGQEETADV
jgi:hypothetical protein